MIMLDRMLERNHLPDALVRYGIRRLLKQRLGEAAFQGGVVGQQASIQALITTLSESPIAVNTQDSKEQHYEVPTAFFQKVLGKHLKYSCCLFEDGTTDLDSAEAAMLALTCERADLCDGHRILELGCGWGSLTLFMAARYPASRITAVSHSKTQKAYIDQQAVERGLSNIDVVTADMNDFVADDLYDRVVSVEMFEHMRNYRELLARIASWLVADGRLFVHSFVHRSVPYLFEVRDDSDWMAKYFFTGGIMPSDHLLLYFADDMQVESHWRIKGTHYGQTSRAWLANMDRHKGALMPLFVDTYGADQATRWWVYWRVFFMACEELWHYRDGEEWFVSHYRFRKR